MRKTLLIITLFFAATFIGKSQAGYQTFPSAGFKVKCGCKLYVNSTFIQMAKQQGEMGIIGAYICAENEDNPDIAVIVNINVYDESPSYKSISTTGYALFEKKYLDQYAKNLSSSGIQYNYTTYKGVSALEYTYDQNGTPTKAIMFLNGKKSYLLQTATRKGLTTKYTALKNSFEIL